MVKAEGTFVEVKTDVETAEEMTVAEVKVGRTAATAEEEMAEETVTGVKPEGSSVVLHDLAEKTVTEEETGEETVAVYLSAVNTAGYLVEESTVVYLTAEETAAAVYLSAEGNAVENLTADDTAAVPDCLIAVGIAVHHLFVENTVVGAEMLVENTVAVAGN